MDIDIDVPSKVNPKDLFPDIIPASINENGVLKKHNVGWYFQPIPVDEISGLSAITYQNAENFNYFKIDIITLKLLDSFSSKEELRELMYKEPLWELLEERKIVETLFHIHNQFNVVYKIKPKSVLALADCLALIRPNKTFLIDKYVKARDKNEIRKVLYTKSDASDLRKSHAIPYAYLIVAQLNLLERELSK